MIDYFAVTKSPYFPEGISAADRFWMHVAKGEGADDCWLWQGKRRDGRYGCMRIGSRVGGGGYVYAHRISWELHNGEIPQGALVLHKCDVPECVNPNHLFLGDNLSNSRDKFAKGRAAIGSKNGNALLTEQDVREIRLSTGTNREIGRRFGVAKCTVAQIRAGLRWKHVNTEA